jgi:hypothetical protein
MSDYRQYLITNRGTGFAECILPSVFLVALAVRLRDIGGDVSRDRPNMVYEEQKLKWRLPLFVGLHLVGWARP